MNKNWRVGVTTLKDDPQLRLHIAVADKDVDGKIIAITGYAGASDEDESIDNAVLIANAPKVLEALKSLVQEIIALDLQDRLSTDVLIAVSVISESTREDVRHLEPIEG